MTSQYPIITSQYPIMISQYPIMTKWKQVFRIEILHLQKYSDPLLSTLLKHLWKWLQPRVFSGMTLQAWHTCVMTWPFLWVDRGIPPSLTLSYTQVLVSPVINFWRRLSPPGHAERERENKGLPLAELLNPQNGRIKHYCSFWECGNGLWTLKGQLWRVRFIWWYHEGQETDIIVSLKGDISQLSGLLYT